MKQFQKDALSFHNSNRSKHGVDLLRLSDDLCKTAQEWAERLAKKDLFEHSKRTDIGENVAMHYSSATTAYSGTLMTRFIGVTVRQDTEYPQGDITLYF